MPTPSNSLMWPPAGERGHRARRRAGLSRHRGMGELVRASEPRSDAGHHRHRRCLALAARYPFRTGHAHPLRYTARRGGRRAGGRCRPALFAAPLGWARLSWRRQVPDYTMTAPRLRRPWCTLARPTGRIRLSTSRTMRCTPAGARPTTVPGPVALTLHARVCLVGVVFVLGLGLDRAEPARFASSDPASCRPGSGSQPQDRCLCPENRVP